MNICCKKDAGTNLTDVSQQCRQHMTSRPEELSQHCRNGIVVTAIGDRCENSVSFPSFLLIAKTDSCSNGGLCVQIEPWQLVK